MAFGLCNAQVHSRGLWNLFLLDCSSRHAWSPWTMLLCLVETLRNTWWAMRRFWTETIKGLPVVGHVISANGVSNDPDKIRAVEQLPIPSNVSNVRHILVCTTVGWTLQRLPPLHCLTAKSIERFQWSSECNRPFSTLKDKLVIAPVLAFPQWCKVHCGWRCEWSHTLVMCWTIVSTWPPIQHYQERDACYGLCNHTLPSLPVWKTVCCQRRPQYTWVDPELSRTQGTSCQLAWVIGPVHLQDWTPTRIEHQNADALLRNPLAVAEDTDQIIQTNAIDSSTSIWV